jgi:hypothetical protein
MTKNGKRIDFDGLTHHQVHKILCPLMFRIDWRNSCFIAGIRFFVVRSSGYEPLKP